MARRIKVSLTLEENVLNAVDAEAERSERPNRSEVVEQALRMWMRHRATRQLDSAIEAYYLELDDQSKAEDNAWARLAEEEAENLWDE